jgi:RNA polymerase sigma-70 factor, ECF subfamily
MDDTHHRARIEAIHAKHSLALLRYLIRFAGERHAAEDMVQETMLRAWRHRDSLPGDENGVRGWLFTVARNLAIDADRMRRVRPAEVALTDLNDTVAAADTPDSALAAQEMARAFAKLSEMQRDVIRHLYFRGDTIEEVATRLGIPAGTVKSRAHYGVQALRAAVTAGAEMGTPVGRGRP